MTVPLPSLDLGIVVLVNSRQMLTDDSATSPSTNPTKPAESIANSILYAIAHGGL